MTTLTKESQGLLARQLSEALEKFSGNKISTETANKVADMALRNVDFSNSTLAHKGINWYAKELLKKINY